MSETKPINCPECGEDVQPTEEVDRRNFIRVVGGAASVLAAGSVAPEVLAVPSTPPDQPARRARPAEALIRELYGTLSAEQRRGVVMAYDHRERPGAMLTRQRMYNGPIGQRISQAYTRPQQELVQRILRSISSDEAGYRCITRNGTFDNSRSLTNCGAYIFGDPTTQQYAWVFTGHHLTVRCDGNSEPGAAFGGPIYYGHSPNGYSQRNVFYFQTQSVRAVFDSLSAAQRRSALVTGSPGEHERSVQFRANNFPGLAASELTQDQKRLVENVMRSILSPYRREDADEVMQIIRQNGGLDQLSLAFYRDRNADNETRWNFWRIEGLGFVWNYRVLPHVHTYVNISSRHANT